MSQHDGHRDRLKREFLMRQDTFPDYRLLELLLYYVNLRADTNATAHNLISCFGSLAGVLDATAEELTKVDGVGEQSVVLLRLAKEIAVRYRAQRTNRSEPVDSPHVLFQTFLPYFFGSRTEKLCLLCMDGQNRNLGVRVIAEGNVLGVEIHARTIAEAALSLNATRIVLAHNHLSGVLKPSDSDLSTTAQLTAVLSPLGLELTDHLLFSDSEMISLFHPEVRVNA